MKKHLLIPLLAALLLPLAASAQTLGEAYVFGTGVDEEAWVTLGDDTTGVNITGDDNASGLLPIGFGFNFCGTTHTQWSVNTNGRMRLGSTAINGQYQTPFQVSNVGVNLPVIVMYGCDNQFYNSSNYCRYAVVGDEGERTLVVEYATSPRSYEGTIMKMQVQLSEADQSVTLVYGEITGSSASPSAYQVGLASATNDIVWVNTVDHTASFLNVGTTNTNATGTWPEEWRYYRFTLNPSACLMASGLTIDTVEERGATLHWNAIEGATYVLTLNGEWLDEVDDTSYTLEELSPYTDYTFGVQTICESGDSAVRPNTVSFTTPCGTYLLDELPLVETFNDYTGSAIHPCWSRMSFMPSRSNYPTLFTGTDHAGETTRMLYCYPGTPEQTQFVVLPPIEDVAGTTVNFWSKRSSTQVVLDLGVMDDPTDTSTFTNVFTFAPFISSDFDNADVNMADYEGEGHYIAIRARSLSGTGSYILIDDITVSVTMACVRPDSVTVSDITPNGATLTIHDPLLTGDYRVVLTTSAGSDTMNVTSATVPLTGLLTGTPYSVEVRTLCGGELTSATLASFNTECAPLDFADLPIAETFDSYTYNYYSVINPCWYRAGYNSAATPYNYPVVVNEHSRHNGAGNTFKFWPAAGSGTNWLVTPAMADINTVKVNFWVMRPSAAPYIEMGVMTDREDTSTFELVTRCEPQQNNVWEEYEATMATYSGEGTYIAFRAACDYGSNYICIDDILIQYDNCPKPIQLDVAYSGHEATLTWNAIDGAQGYEVIVAGLDTATAATNSYTIDSVASSHTYQVQIRTLCSESSASSWFTTTLDVPVLELPYTETFDALAGNSLPEGWSHLADGTIAPSTSHTYRGTQNLRFSGANTQNIAVLPAMPTDISQLQVDFMTVPESPTNPSCGQFDIGYVANPANPASFVALATYNYTDFAADVYQHKTMTFAGAPAGARIAMRHRATATNWYWFVDSVVVSEATCIMPGQPTAVEVGSDTVRLSWHAAGADGLDYEVSLEGSNALPLTVADTACTLTGLQPGTSYTAIVAHRCDDTLVASATVSFTTQCTVLAIDDLPYTDDFQSYAVGQNGTVNPCWTMLNHYTTMPYVATTQGPDGTTTNILYLYPGLLPASQIVAFRAVEDPTAVMVAFLAKPGNVNVRYELGVMDDPADSSTFTAVQSFTPTNTNWTEHEVSLADYAGQGQHIALRAYTVGSSGYALYIDDLAIIEAPSCLRPESISVSALDANSITVSVTDPTGVGNYRLSLVGGSTADTVDITSGVTFTGHTFTGLNPSTTYTLGAAAICADGTVTSFVHTTATTPCGAVSLPFDEDFTGVNNISDLQCWDYYAAPWDDVQDGTSPLTPSNSYLYIRNNEGAFNTTHFVINIFSTGVTAWAVSPQVTIDAAAELSFDLGLNRWGTAAAPNGSLNDDRFIVAVTTDGGTSWTPLCMWGSDASRDDSVYANIPATLQTVRFALTDYVGQTVRVAFYGESTVAGDDNALRLDNIAIHYTGDAPQPEPCAAPQATLEEEASVLAPHLFIDGSAASYEVAVLYGQWDETEAENTAENIGQVSEWNPGNYTDYIDHGYGNYHIGVRSVCADGSRSEWTVVVFEYFSVGIDGVDAMGFRLYPNPATTSVTLEWHDAAARVEVISLNGQVVMSQQPNGSRATLDIATLPSGTYFVRLVGASGTAVHKLAVK